MGKKVTVPEVKKPERVTEKDALEARFQTEWSSLRHLGTSGTRRAWSEQQSGPGKFTGSQGHRKKPSQRG